MRTLVSRIAFHTKGARRASICSPMSGDIGVDAGDPAQHGREQELAMVGELPVDRSAQLILLLYLDKRRRPEIRIHGRPRSDRKRRFLLSAVAPSTGTRHPREARPINWAQRGGLASGRANVSLTPRPHFTAHHARLVTRWLLLRTALLFVRSAVRLVYAELPGPVAVCLPKQALCELGDRVLDGDREALGVQESAVAVA